MLRKIAMITVITLAALTACTSQATFEVTSFEVTKVDTDHGHTNININVKNDSNKDYTFDKLDVYVVTNDNVTIPFKTNSTILANQTTQIKAVTTDGVYAQNNIKECIVKTR